MSEQPATNAGQHPKENDIMDSFRYSLDFSATGRTAPTGIPLVENALYETHEEAIEAMRVRPAYADLVAGEECWTGESDDYQHPVYETALWENEDDRASDPDGETAVKIRCVQGPLHGLTEGWDVFVGDQGVDEFVDYSEGTAEEMVSAYVASSQACDGLVDWERAALVKLLTPAVETELASRADPNWTGAEGYVARCYGRDGDEPGDCRVDYGYCDTTEAWWLQDGDDAVTASGPGDEGMGPFASEEDAEQAARALAYERDESDGDGNAADQRDRDEAAVQFLATTDGQWAVVWVEPGCDDVIGRRYDAEADATTEVEAWLRDLRARCPQALVHLMQHPVVRDLEVAS